MMKTLTSARKEGAARSPNHRIEQSSRQETGRIANQELTTLRKFVCPI